MRRALLASLLAIAAAIPAAGNPLMQDPLGPLVDVTADWQSYQPSNDFCIPLDAFDFHRSASGDRGEACDAEDTYRVRIQTPPLCAGCRRLFIDYGEIGENDPAAGLFYAHGHAYWRMQSFNPSYTIDPIAHSPNIKNVTNDKFVAPEGSIQEHVAHAFDLHAMSYVGDTASFHHNQIQGPYYIGPWYVNEDGEVIRGAYLDVDVAGARSSGNPNLDEIRYWAGFNAGEATCPDSMWPPYADGDYYYAGCATHPGMSSTGVDPFS